MFNQQRVIPVLLAALLVSAVPASVSAQTKGAVTMTAVPKKDTKPMTGKIVSLTYQGQSTAKIVFKPWGITPQSKPFPEAAMAFATLTVTVPCNFAITDAMQTFDGSAPMNTFPVSTFFPRAGTYKVTVTGSDKPLNGLSKCEGEASATVIVLPPSN